VELQESDGRDRAAPRTRRWRARLGGSRGRAAAGVAGAIAVAATLGFVLAGRREEFAQALHSAPVVVLVAAAALQLVALVSRCEAWHACVSAAGGVVGRRRLYGAASLGNLASQLNPNLGAAARIAVLRRLAPTDAPRVPALIAAEVPILSIEAILAALTSFTLVGPLGLPWWLPLALLAVAVLIVAGLRALAGRHRQGVWAGLAVLRTVRGRTRVLALVLVAVFAQIVRNWLVLHALGVDASLFDAIAVLIAMVVLSQLPVGPTVGAAAVVVILGADGVALAAAAGVLLTATGTVGALCFAGYAGLDRLARRGGRGKPEVARPGPAIALDPVRLAPIPAPAAPVAGAGS
jgi:uncharacterized membrane protein YbhN (UPF0104 family)